ncbi:MAG: thiamine phosphate synthase [Treponema sp.]|nr:thiamine phosphate synthase [Treponema sp.]MDY4131464.1 thiamine phosphate synthase [Treponema sp.]MDY5838949.1 thiamine phosphate synthase [Treponema sp.]
MNKDALSLYGITDRYWLNGRPLIHDVQLALEGGVTMIQLREKNLDEESFYREAIEIKELCKKFHVPFIINDNVELAKKVDADGIHVGQNDMAAQDVRAIIGPDKILGVSTQTVEEALLAQKMGADYLGVGAVFPTGSKDDCWVLSHDLCREICSAVTIPVVAIGGINLGNISKLSGLGFSGISLISAIFGQNDIKSAAMKLKEEVSKII